MMYLTEERGRYYFKPTPTMRKSSFRAESFGTDRQKAERRVTELTEEWKEIRSGKNELVKQKASVPKNVQGTFDDLIRRFMNDPEWYGSRAQATRDEMDLCFNEVRKTYSDILVKTLKHHHGVAYYNQLREEHGASIHKSRKVMKWFRRLMSYARKLGWREDNPLTKMSITAPNQETSYGRKIRLTSS